MIYERRKRTKENEYWELLNLRAVFLTLIPSYSQVISMLSLKKWNPVQFNKANSANSDVIGYVSLTLNLLLHKNTCLPFCLVSMKN